jgi:hypothetical protein
MVKCFNTRDLIRFFIEVKKNNVQNGKEIGGNGLGGGGSRGKTTMEERQSGRRVVWVSSSSFDGHLRLGFWDFLVRPS